MVFLSPEDKVAISCRPTVDHAFTWLLRLLPNNMAVKSLTKAKTLTSFPLVSCFFRCARCTTPSRERMLLTHSIEVWCVGTQVNSGILTPNSVLLKILSPLFIICCRRSQLLGLLWLMSLDILGWRVQLSRKSNLSNVLTNSWLLPRQNEKTSRINLVSTSKSKKQDREDAQNNVILEQLSCKEFWTPTPSNLCQPFLLAKKLLNLWSSDSHSE